MWDSRTISRNFYPCASKSPHKLERYVIIFSDAKVNAICVMLGLSNECFINALLFHASVPAKCSTVGLSNEYGNAIRPNSRQQCDDEMRVSLCYPQTPWLSLGRRFWDPKKLIDEFLALKTRGTLLRVDSFVVTLIVQFVFMDSNFSQISNSSGRKCMQNGWSRANAPPEIFVASYLDYEYCRVWRLWSSSHLDTSQPRRNSWATYLVWIVGTRGNAMCSLFFTLHVRTRGLYFKLHFPPRRLC